MRRIKSLTKSARGIFEPRKLEEDVLGEIRLLLELNHCLVFRAIERVPKCYRCGCWLGSSEKGLPDLSGLMPREGREPFPFFLEIKRAVKSARRPAQIEIIDRIKSVGGLAAFVSSWQDVKNEFEKMKITFKVG